MLEAEAPTIVEARPGGQFLGDTVVEVAPPAGLLGTEGVLGCEGLVVAPGTLVL